MDRRCTLILMVLALAAVSSATCVSAQPDTPGDSLALATAGYEDGLASGQRASMARARWGTAAATFLLTPVLGGTGSLIAAHTADGYPRTMPTTPAEAAHPAYREGYRSGFSEGYLPRYRRTVRRSVLVTSAAFFAGMLLLAG